MTDLDRLAVRQMDAALKFYAEQMPAYAASADLDREAFAAVMVDVEAVRGFVKDATIRSLVAAVRERDELRALVRQEHAVVAPPPYTEYHLANCPVPAALHSKDGADE